MLPSVVLVVAVTVTAAVVVVTVVVTSTSSLDCNRNLRWKILQFPGRSSNSYTRTRATSARSFITRSTSHLPTVLVRSHEFII